MAVDGEVHHVHYGADLWARCFWSCVATSRKYRGRSGCGEQKCRRRSPSSPAIGSSPGRLFKANLFGLVAAGFAVYAAHHHFIAKRPAKYFGWRYIAWLLPWFGGMWVLSALSDVGGGLHVLSFWPGGWSLIVTALAMRSALPAAETEEIMIRMNPHAADKSGFCAAASLAAFFW